MKRSVALALALVAMGGAGSARAESARTETKTYVPHAVVGLPTAREALPAGQMVRFGIGPGETSVQIDVSDTAGYRVAAVAYWLDTVNDRPLGGVIFCGSTGEVGIPADATAVNVAVQDAAWGTYYSVSDFVGNNVLGWGGNLQRCEGPPTLGTITASFR